MDNQNTFRYLVKLAGKILFVIGLVLNILMLFFGFWPGLIYILIMLAGAGLVSFGKSTENYGSSLNKFSVNISGFFAAISNNLAFNSETVLRALKTIIITFAGMALLLFLFLRLSQEYFKKRDTIADCNAITIELQDYYNHNKQYPSNLSIIINKNPLRQSWTKDAWGNEYVYIPGTDTKSFTLTSKGKDGRLNTADDLIFTNQ